MRYRLRTLLIVLVTWTLEFVVWSCQPIVRCEVAAQEDNTNQKSGAGRELLSLKGHIGPVRDIAFSPDGKMLASAGWDKTVKVWNAITGQKLFTLGHAGPVVGLAFSPDGKQLLTGGDDAKPDDNTIALGDVRLWDTMNQRELLKLRGHQFFVEGVAFSPDAHRVASASVDSTAKIWDAKTGKEVFTLPHVGQVWNVAFSSDGKRVASASYSPIDAMSIPRKPGRVTIWDATNGQELSVLRHTDDVWSVVYSPDGNRLAAVTHGFVFIGPSESASGPIRDLKAVLNSLTIKAPDIASFSARIAFSSNGKLLAASVTRENEGNPGEVKVWDSTTAKELLTLACPERSGAISFSPDGKQLAAAGMMGTVKVWQIAEGRRREY